MGNSAHINVFMLKKSHKKSHSTCPALCIIYNWQLMKWLFTQLKLWTDSRGAKLSQSLLREGDSMETKDRQLIFFSVKTKRQLWYTRGMTHCNRLAKTRDQELLVRSRVEVLERCMWIICFTFTILLHHYWDCVLACVRRQRYYEDVGKIICYRNKS